MRFHLRAILVCIVLFGHSVAFAQQPPEGQAEATKHWNLGNTAYTARDYERAVVEYLEAYRLHPTTQLLFNIAQAYRLKGDRTNAIDYYRRFLLEAPGRGGEEAKGHLTQLLREAQAEEAARGKPPEDDQTPRLPVDAPVGSTGAGGNAATNEASRTHTAPADDSSGRTQRLWGFGVVAVGIAALGTGTYFAFRASNRADRIDDNCPCLWKDIEQLDEEGRRAALTAKVSLSIGAAALIGGGVLYYVGVRKRTPTVALVPSSSGLAFTWTSAY